MSFSILRRGPNAASSAPWSHGQRLVFKSTEHQGTLQRQLHRQWTSAQNCDLVIKADAIALPVHSCVAACFSTKIGTHLLSARQVHIKSKQPTVYLLKEDRVEFSFHSNGQKVVRLRAPQEVAEGLVAFMYTGSLSIQRCLTANLLVMAHTLGMTPVVKMVQVFVDMNPDIVERQAEWPGAGTTNRQQPVPGFARSLPAGGGAVWPERLVVNRSIASRTESSSNAVSNFSLNSSLSANLLPGAENLQLDPVQLRDIKEEATDPDLDDVLNLPSFDQATGVSDEMDGSRHSLEKAGQSNVVSCKGRLTALLQARDKDIKQEPVDDSFQQFNSWQSAKEAESDRADGRQTEQSLNRPKEEEMDIEELDKRKAEAGFYVDLKDNVKRGGTVVNSGAERRVNSSGHSPPANNDADSRDSMDDNGVHNDMDDNGVHNDMDDNGVHNDMDDNGVHNDMDDNGVHSDMDDNGVHSDMDDNVVHNDTDDNGVHNDTSDVNEIDNKDNCSVDVVDNGKASDNENTCDDANSDRIKDDADFCQDVADLDSKDNESIREDLVTNVAEDYGNVIKCKDGENSDDENEEEDDFGFLSSVLSDINKRQQGDSKPETEEDDQSEEDGPAAQEEKTSQEGGGKVAQFTCPLCKRCYAFKRSLKSHMAKFHKDASLLYSKACLYCGEQFTSRPKYRLHCRSVHGQLACDVRGCDYTNAESDAMDAHTSAVHGFDPSCRRCDKTLRTKRSMVDHLHKEHADFACQLCQTKFICKSRLTLHFRSDHNLDQYPYCRPCKIGFQSAEDMAEHQCVAVATVAADFSAETEENVVEAKGEGSALVGEGSCRQARKGVGRRRKGQPYMRPQRCSFCKERLESKPVLYQHLLESHPDDCYPCPECPKVFVRPEGRSTHLTLIHRMRVWNCHHCTDVFKVSKDYISHSLAEHGDRRPFKCPKEACSFTSGLLRSYNFHLKCIHSDRSEVCHRCDGRFPSSIHLRLHHRSCLKLEQHLCAICGAIFHIKQTLVSHINNMHGGERRYKCFKCDKRFSCYANRTRHMRIHDNTFPYECDACGLKFRHSNTLKDHKHRKH